METVDLGPVQLELTQEQVGNIAYIVNSPAWTDSFRPMLVGMLRGFYLDLADPSRNRKEGKPDDYLRGGIAVVRAFLAFPEQVLEEAAAEEAAEAAQKAEEEKYAERAASGEIGPMGIAYDPAQDF